MLMIKGNGSAQLLNSNWGFGTLTGSVVAHYMGASGTTASGKNLTVLQVDALGTGLGGNYAAVFTGGRVGIGTATPTAGLDLQNASGNLNTLFNSNLNYGTGVSSSNVANNFTATYGSGGGTLTGLKVTVSHPTAANAIAAVFQGGRVGIGINLPITTLDVRGTTNLADQVAITGNTANQEALVVNQAQATGAIVNFRQGNVSKAIIDNRGFFGIGIVAPIAKLDLQDVSGNLNTIFNSNLNYGTGVSGSFTANTIAASYGATSTGSVTGLKVSVSNAGTGQSNAAIFQGGRVGIGIDVPTAKLDLQDVSGNLNTIFNSNLNYGTGVSGSYTANTIAASYGATSTGSVTGLKVSVSHPTPGKAIAAVFQGGRVGIGIDAPSATLDVQGTTNLANQTIITGNTNGQEALIVTQAQTSGAIADFRSGGSSKVTIDNGGNVNIAGAITVASVKTAVWSIAPDYVFDKEYKLASLEHVAKYLEQNKHLPEIPSAKDMKTQGMDLAEMNLKLLKKVEELTLHAIRQEKEMNAIRQRLNRFEKGVGHVE